MRRKVNKKGAELSMNVIIITILAVLVLVIVAVIFTGGMSSLTNKIRNIFQHQALDLQSAISECNGYCNGYSISKVDSYKDSFCGYNDKKFDIDTDGDGEADLLGQTCPQLNVQCDEIPSCG